jgi:hypothetical protein
MELIFLQGRQNKYNVVIISDNAEKELIFQKCTSRKAVTEAGTFQPSSEHNAKPGVQMV